MKRKRCNNCAFAGERFKISKGGTTHLYCQHPSIEKKEGYEPLDYLKEFSDKCDKFTHRR